jgi:uncharacterized membrane protein YeaQ/YmgE (transglycosylase-associated protein family)
MKELSKKEIDNISGGISAGLCIVGLTAAWVGTFATNWAVGNLKFNKYETKSFQFGYFVMSFISAPIITAWNLSIEIPKTFADIKPFADICKPFADIWAGALSAIPKKNPNRNRKKK